MKITLCLIQKWNGIFTRALGVIFLVFFMGCERDCIQGQMRGCTCQSRAESMQICSESGYEWEECDCACDPDETPSRKCACPPSDTKRYNQYCKASPQSGDEFQWHPCECPTSEDTSADVDTIPTDPDDTTEELDTSKGIDAGPGDGGQ